MNLLFNILHELLPLSVGEKILWSILLVSSYFWCLCELLSTREKCNGAVQDHQARVHAERTAAFEERTEKGTAVERAIRVLLH